MEQSSFLGDLLTTLFERRRNASRISDGRSIYELCSAILASEGEVSGINLSRAILNRYGELEEDGKLAFFTFLNDDLELDIDRLVGAARAYAQTDTLENYETLTGAVEPRRQELLRRLNQSTGATAALVAMRADFLDFLPNHAHLKRTDMDFVHLLRSWFNRGFLVLRQINWETPASILDKIVEYEAVHAINDWDDLRRRVYPPDRRCFAYFHPTMPGEPLIFVEVALTQSVPSSIADVLAEDRTYLNPGEASVAVFYSISNCQKGLHGISFGNLLIKQVVDELRQELPQLKTFATLSPIPGLNRWLGTLTGDPVVEHVLTGEARDEDVATMAAQYLVYAKDKHGAPDDPVARFHLGNGAQIHAVHANADLTEKGLRQSSGAMVNYLYDLDMIEKNHERFVQGREIMTSRSFKVPAEPDALKKVSA